MTYEVTVPPNTTATVVLPGTEPTSVSTARPLDPSVYMKVTNAGAELTVGAGTYKFTFPTPRMPAANKTR